MTPNEWSDAVYEATGMVVTREQAQAIGEMAITRGQEVARLRDALRAFLSADDHWLRGNKGGEWAAMMAIARSKARAALGEYPA